MATAFKMMNSPTTVVNEMLQGLVHSSPDLCLVPEYRIVLHRDFNDLKQRQVTLLAGGGSGHEPAHAGYIGDGMLTGVICGDVFASPSTKQVLTAIRLAAGPHGCLIIVKNYTGDRLNFGLAIETAKAEGINVDMVVIGDDLAIPDAKAGHRGLAGTVFVHKIAGAMAVQGFPLREIAGQVQQLVIGTMGVAWTSCTLPGQASSRHIKPHEMELGLGIHGEPGAKTIGQLSSKDTVAELLATIQNGIHVARNDRVVVMVNNLGSVTPMELQVIVNDVRHFCVAQGLVVQRIAVGSFMTALDMAGVSLTVWKLSADHEAQQLAWLDAAVTAPAWPSRLGRFVDDNVVEVVAVAPSKSPASLELTAAGRLLKRAIFAATQSIIDAEADLTAWDTKVGDGDCGVTLSSGAKAIQGALVDFPLNVPSKTLSEIAHTIGNAIGGTSGVLYTIFFTAAGATMHTFDHGLEASEPTSQAWVESFVAGVAAIQKYGGATEGSRTMLDAMLPALRAAQKTDLPFAEWAEAVKIAALEGADSTKRIAAHEAFGRTSYVGEAFVKDVPDPGAMAVAIWIQALVQTLQQ